MTDEANVRVEYQVRPVTRYIVTRYCETDGPGGQSADSVCKGEFENADAAYQVGYALAKHDHELLGYPVGDDRIQYPKRPEDVEASFDPRGTRS